MFDCYVREHLSRLVQCDVMIQLTDTDLAKTDLPSITCPLPGYINSTFIVLCPFGRYRT